MSCEQCTNIVFKPWDQLDSLEAERISSSHFNQRNSDDSDWSIDVLTLVCAHQDNMAKLELSGQQCHFCHKLYAAFKHAMRVDHPHTDIIEPNPDLPICLSIKIPFRCESVRDGLDHVKEISAHCGFYFVKADVRVEFRDSTFSVLSDAGPMHLFLAPDKESADQDQHTMSSRNLLLASAWYKQCTETHGRRCQITRDAALPLLVLNIADCQRPYLTYGRGRKTDYATLSYKWGQGQRLLTTTKNYTAFEKGIDVNELPKTFSDAIMVANQIGFTFLWIDALCIRHDVLEELTEQISMMASIFAMSSLTIFAAWGETAHSGLGVPRDSWLVKPSKIVIKAARKKSLCQSPIYCDGFPGKHIDRTSIESALYTRGWVLQEQILSLRGLMFNADHVSWHCPTLRDRTSEQLLKPDSTYHIHSGIEKHFFNAIGYGCWLRGAKYGSFDTAVLAWYPLIENYHTRNLTYTSDALPALSGLASLIEQQYKCSYLAGLWQPDVRFGLLWAKTTNVTYFDSRWPSKQIWLRPINHKEGQRFSHGILRRDTEGSNMWVTLQDRSSRGPSWSWASSFGTQTKQFQYVLKGRYKCSRKQPIFELIDTAITQRPGYTNPFGEVEFAMLRVKAPVKAAIISLYDERDDCEDTIRYRLLDPATVKGEGGSGMYIGELYPDDKDTCIYDDCKILCVVCAKEDHYSGALVSHCIAVVPAEEPGQYIRVGFAILHGMYDRDEGSLWGDMAPDEIKTLDLI